MTTESQDNLVKELNGKYFVQTIHVSDREYEGDCISLYQLRSGELKGVVGADVYPEEAEFQAEKINKKVVDYLKEKRVKTVYTAMGYPKIFDTETDWEFSEDEEDNPTYFGRLEAICSDEWEYKFLTDQEFEIMFVDYDRAKIIKD